MVQVAASGRVIGGILIVIGIPAMVGDLDDVVIGSIAATGASLAEVALAVEWLRGDRGLEDEAGHEPHGVTRAVYDILRAEEIDDV